MLFEKKYFESSQGKLRYFQSGSGRAVLFLHGSGVRALTYKEILGLFSQKYRVIAPDLPCFGESFVPEGSWNYDDYADLLAEMISFLRLKKVIVVGHSLGGGIALFLSAKTRRVSHLVLVDSAGSRFERSQQKVFGKYLLKKTLTDIHMYHKPKVLLSTGGDVLANIINKFPKINQVLKIINEVLIKDFSDFDKIKVPTLILWGDKDEIFPLSVAKKFHRKIALSELVSVAGNHDWCLFRPEKFFKIADNWLKKHE